METPESDPGNMGEEEKSISSEVTASDEIDLNSPPTPQRDPGPMEDGQDAPQPSGGDGDDGGNGGGGGGYGGYEYTTPYPTEGYYYYTTTPWYATRR